MIIGRAVGLALGLGCGDPEPAHLWAALAWAPDGVTSKLLAALGSSRRELLDALGDVGRLVPVASEPNPLPRAAETQALALEHGGTVDGQLLLVLH